MAVRQNRPRDRKRCRPLRAFPAAVREQEASRILQEEAAKPFDSENHAILRARLLRLDAEDHILFLNTHHIASDGWSFGVLRRA